ncbi:hypothetical protein PGS49_09345 [Yersinia intermedia]|uniref:hypothetical protein n=1 Tax=Yersinia intermedia TaxID=631 RepID=UPI0022FECDB8|nr:hypothetical protein [Yersinia intermedia]MDA5480863.1 hypothetical protein [Yersinia intermedia]
MSKLYRHASLFISLCWSALAYIAIDVLYLGRVWRKAVRVAEYVARAVSHLTPVIAQWRIVESVCTKNIREQINTFGQCPRSTGALNCPLL